MQKMQKCKSFMTIRKEFEVDMKIEPVDLEEILQRNSTSAISVMLAEECRRDYAKFRPSFERPLYHLVYSDLRQRSTRLYLKAKYSKHVSQAILIPQPCYICGAPKVEGHHYDYRYPFWVFWLCKRHHLLQSRGRRQYQFLGQLPLIFPSHNDLDRERRIILQRELKAQREAHWRTISRRLEVMAKEQKARMGYENSSIDLST